MSSLELFLKNSLSLPNSVPPASELTLSKTLSAPDLAISIMVPSLFLDSYRFDLAVILRSLIGPMNVLLASLIVLESSITTAARF